MECPAKRSQLRSCGPLRGPRGLRSFPGEGNARILASGRRGGDPEGPPPPPADWRNPCRGLVGSVLRGGAPSLPSQSSIFPLIPVPCRDFLLVGNVPRGWGRRRPRRSSSTSRWRTGMSTGSSACAARARALRWAGRLPSFALTSCVYCFTALFISIGGWISGLLMCEGISLQFIDKEGKTPLIVACMRPDLLPVAKALIDLGANVNAYRPGKGTTCSCYYPVLCSLSKSPLRLHRLFDVWIPIRAVILSSSDVAR